MADTETVEKRPACDYPVERVKPGNPAETESKPCGSENGIFHVKARGPWNLPQERDICDRHIGKAWHELEVESAEKRPLPSKRTG